MIKTHIYVCVYIMVGGESHRSLILKVSTGMQIITQPVNQNKLSQNTYCCRRRWRW